MQTEQTLSPKQQAIAPIAAFAATGQMAQLQTALGQGLDAGLTVSDCKEILVQLYAYAGFPRSLNALNALMAVLEQRTARGIEDVPGIESEPVPEGEALLAAGTANQTRLVGAPVKGPLFDFAPQVDRWLVGMGMASAIRGAPVIKSAARVTLAKDGGVTVETDMTDIGTGSYTILAQTAAEMLGVALSQVVVRLGDSRFPEGAGSGGQFGAASSTAGVYAACVKLRAMVAQRLGFGETEVEFADGRVRSGGNSRPLLDALAQGELRAEDAMEYGDLSKRYAQQTFAAHFVEVGVDSATGEIRIRRMLAVCAAGRIINPMAARSQIIGGMTMGAGAALMEELVVDRRAGFFVNHDLAGYEVPVHADIPHQEVIFLDEVDPTIGPLKAKGVGELGISGVPAAIANAVYNATGVRVRDYPITLDKLLDHLPKLA